PCCRFEQIHITHFPPPLYDGVNRDFRRKLLVDIDKFVSRQIARHRLFGLYARLTMRKWLRHHAGSGQFPARSRISRGLTMLAQSHCQTESESRPESRCACCHHKTDGAPPANAAAPPLCPSALDRQTVRTHAAWAGPLPPAANGGHAHPACVPERPRRSRTILPGRDSECPARPSVYIRQHKLAFDLDARPFIIIWPIIDERVRAAEIGSTR